MIAHDVNDTSSSFGDADESQRRGLQIAAMQSFMELLQIESSLKSTLSSSSRARHLFDAVQLRDLLLVLCEVPAGAKRVERIKLSLTEMASSTGLKYDPAADVADNDDDGALSPDDARLALIEEFCTAYTVKYDDVRFYSMRIVARMCESVRRAATIGKCTLDETARFSRLVHALLAGLAPPSSLEADDAPLHFFVAIAPGKPRQGGKAKRNGNDDDDNDDSGSDDIGGALHDADVDDATFLRLLQDSDSEDVAEAGAVDDAQTQANTRGKRKHRGGAGDGTLRVESRREHRKAFGACWLAFLRLPLPPRVFEASLARLTDSVLPHMEQPLLLCDLLTNAFSRGGSIALLALSGLFELIVKHNLDYPHFFEQLYSLLDANIFLVKYRARFFELMSMFLAGPMLPASTAAAFVRRVLRLAATGPAYAGLLAVPFALNVIRRHPSCVPMIHREELVTGVPTRQAAANASSLFAAASTKQSALQQAEQGERGAS
jgi:hypothetical protein